MTTTETTTTTPPDLDALRAAVAEGERAHAVLAEQTRQRQEAATAALAAAQQEHDADVCRRAPELDADLTAQQREADRDVEAAVERDDLDAALAAWRRGRAARHAQRQLRDAWRTAHSLVGVGPTPPAPSLRIGQVDDLTTFSAAVDRAAARSALLAADVLATDLLPERPTAAPEELLPAPGASLRHADTCPGPRPEVSTAPSGHRSHGTVVRCLNCAATEVLVPPPVEPEAEQARTVGQYAPTEPPRGTGAWS